MKTLKVVAIVLLLGLVALLCFGCGESFSYTEYIDDGGGVHREFLFLYDKDAADAEAVKEQAIRMMNQYVSDQELEKYATIDASSDGEVCLYLDFPYLTDYYVAYGYTGREENEPSEPTKKGFVERYDVEKESYLSEKNVAYVRSLAEEEFKNFPMDCDFYYTYGTAYKTVKSNGEVKKQDGIYWHTWKIEYGKPSDIKITNYALNGVLVISIIILVFVLSLAVIFAIIIINKKKNANFRATEEIVAGTEDGDVFPKG